MNISNIRSYDYYYNKAWRHLTMFYWWSRTETRAYDIFHGEFNKAWTEYMQSGDEYAVEAKGKIYCNETAKQAFFDYVRNYIKNLRVAEHNRALTN